MWTTSPSHRCARSRRSCRRAKDDPPPAFIKRRPDIGDADHRRTLANGGLRWRPICDIVVRQNLSQTNDELLCRQHALLPHAALATFSGPACSMARM
jgi:hypothetical protein